MSKHEWYLPDFAHECDQVEVMFNEGGPGHADIERNARRLYDAIVHYEPDPRKQGPLLSKIQPTNVGHLRYLNPYTRAVWCRAVAKGFQSVSPGGPLMKVTIIPRGEEVCTQWSHFGFRRKFHRLSRDLAKQMNKIGASCFGHMEMAVFPKRLIEMGGYAAHPHFELICWGCSENELRRALKPRYRPLDDGTTGYWVRDITRTFHRVVAYASKAPMYGYSAWPSGADGKRHKTVAIPLQGLWDIMEFAGDTTWDDLVVSVGEGEGVLQAALEAAKPNFKPQGCPKRDKSRSRKYSVDAMREFTLETNIDEGIKKDAANEDIEELVLEAKSIYDNYASAEGHTTDQLYEFLGRAYRLARNCRIHEAELQRIAKERRLRCNRRTDLFGLAIQFCLDGQQIDRRRRNEWARALQYLHLEKCTAMQVPDKLRAYGGVRPCAAMITHGGKAPVESPLTQDLATIRKKAKADAKLAALLTQLANLIRRAS